MAWKSLEGQEGGGEEDGCRLLPGFTSTPASPRGSPAARPGGDASAGRLSALVAPGPRGASAAWARHKHVNKTVTALVRPDPWHGLLSFHGNDRACPPALTLFPFRKASTQGTCWLLKGRPDTHPCQLRKAPGPGTGYHPGHTPGLETGGFHRGISTLAPSSPLSCLSLHGVLWGCLFTSNSSQPSVSSRTVYSGVC